MDQYSKRLTLKTQNDYSFVNMSSQQLSFIAGYFEVPYLTNVTQLMVDNGMKEFEGEIQTFSPGYFNTSHILFMNNESDHNQIIIGVSGPEAYQNDTFEMQALFSVNKSSLKISDPWVLDFTIEDNNPTSHF